MSLVLEFVLEAVAEIAGQLLMDLILKPFHWVAWATGAALCLLISLGRLQIEPFVSDGEWAPEEGRPILYAVHATTAGIAAWAILGTVIFRPYIL